MRYIPFKQITGQGQIPIFGRRPGAGQSRGRRRQRGFACFLSREDKGPNPQEAQVLAKSGLNMTGYPPQGLPDYRSVITPIPPLVAAAKVLGNVGCGPDPDGIYRRLPLVAPFKEQWLPLLGFAAYQRQAAASPWRFEDDALVREICVCPLTPRGGFF